MVYAVLIYLLRAICLALVLTECVNTGKIVAGMYAYVLFEYNCMISLKNYCEF